MGTAYGEASVVTAAEISRNFGRWQDRALTGPVVVTHHGRPRVIVVAAEQYQCEEPPSFYRDPGAEAGPPLSALLENMSSGLIALDEDLHIRTVNRITEAQLGKDRHHLVGMSLADVVRQSASMLVENCRRVLRTGDALAFDAQSTANPGRTFAFRAFPYPGGMALLFDNITEIAGLRERVNLLESLKLALEGAPQTGWARLNIRGVLTETSSQFCTLSKFSAQELLGNRLTNFVVGRDKHLLGEAIEDVLANRRQRREDVCLLVKDHTEVTVTISMAPIIGHILPDGLTAAISVTRRLRS